MLTIHFVNLLQVCTVFYQHELFQLQNYLMTLSTKARHLITRVKLKLRVPAKKQLQPKRVAKGLLTLSFYPCFFKATRLPFMQSTNKKPWRVHAQYRRSVFKLI